MLNRSVLAVLIVAVWVAALSTGYVLQHRENDARAEVLAEAKSGPSSATPTPIPMVTLAPAVPSVPALAPPLPEAAPPIPASPAPASPPAAVAPVAPARVAGTPCKATVSACVNLSSRRAWLISDGKVVFGPVSITSGKKGERTPVGMHEVLWKDAKHKSKEFDDAPMPWSVFFADGGIAFHTGSLRAQSSGCVHLSNAVAQKFFHFLEVGDLVQVVR